MMIKARNLTFGYDQTNIIDGLSFEFKPGRLAAIAGPNGVGKSTLLELMCGNFKPANGRITLGGRPLSRYSRKKLAKKLAVVRQEFVPPFGFTVYETVMMARTSHFDLFGFETETDKNVVERYLEITEISHLAARRLDQISGGERQRVFVARALAQETPVMLLDEPTSYLDMKHQVGIYDLLKSMQIREKKTIVTIIHDINLARQYCEDVLLLGNGGKSLFGDAQEIFNQTNIRDFYDVDSVCAQKNNIKIYAPVGKYGIYRKNRQQDK